MHDGGHADPLGHHVLGGADAGAVPGDVPDDFVRQAGRARHALEDARDLAVAEPPANGAVAERAEELSTRDAASREPLRDQGQGVGGNVGLGAPGLAVGLGPSNTFGRVLRRFEARIGFERPIPEVRSSLFSIHRIDDRRYRPASH